MVIINGQPLLFKGTNRHDTDPVYGKYVPKDVYEKDIENLEKTDTPKKRIRTINNKQNGYINFYLILISTIFLSLLCILLSFMMLGLNIK